MSRNPLQTADEDQDFSRLLQDIYLQARILLRRFWWLVLLTTALGIGFKLYQESQREPAYVSRAKMYVQDRVRVPEGDAYQEQYVNFFGTQIDLMTSAQVRQRARARVASLHPELDPVSVSLNAGQKEETAIFILNAVGLRPEYTQEFLNAVLEEYKNLRREMRDQTAQEAVVGLNKRLYELEEKIEREEQEIVEFEKKNNLVAIQERGTSAGSYLARLKNQEADLRTQLHILENMGLDSQISGSDLSSTEAAATLPLFEELRTDEYRAARNQLERVKAEVEDFSRFLRPRHPKIIGLQDEVERMQNMVRIVEQQTRANLADSKRILRAKMQNLQDVISDWEDTALENSRLAAEHDQMQSRLQRSRKLYEGLLDSVRSIDLSANAPESVGVLEWATDAQRVPVPLARNVAVGGALGFLIGAGLVFLFSRLENRIHTEEDLERNFKAPVMGVIPQEKPAKDGYLSPLKPRDPRHLFSEACRTLRSSLLFMRPNGERPSLIMVTSSVPEEGKSTIALNLSVALSFTSSRTLLVDADLRRGRLAKALDMKNETGLSQVLEGKVPFEEAVQPTGIDNLDFLSTGDLPDRPGELLLSKRMEDLMQKLRQSYDFVIFDSAPILATDDSVGFSVGADAILFVVRSNHTNQRQASSAVSRLEMRGVKVSGFVLNCVDTKSTDYYYHKKYQDYYAHPQA